MYCGPPAGDPTPARDPTGAGAGAGAGDKLHPRVKSRVAFFTRTRPAPDPLPSLMLSMFPEIMNLRNLERVLAREEEVKKKAVVHKDTYDGPIVRFCSRDGNRFTRLSSHLFTYEL